METFHKLFGSLLALVYHCFDRVVILGYLPLLTRPENIVHFFRDVQGIRAITKEVLRERTDDYHRWVETFARTHQIPIEWAEKVSNIIREFDEEAIIVWVKIKYAKRENERFISWGVV